MILTRNPLAQVYGNVPSFLLTAVGASDTRREDFLDLIVSRDGVVDVALDDSSETQA